jgi:Mg2+ and Co2+ transporter CorA
MQQTVQLGDIQWIHLAQPDSEVIHQLAKEEGLHEILVDDLLEINSHSKIDSNSDNIFVALTFTRYLPEEQRYILKEIDAIIKENSIITTCALESDVINELLDTLPKEFTHHTAPVYKNSPYYVLYKIIDAFYDKTIRSLEHSSRTLLHIQESIAIKKAEHEVVEELMNHNLNKITLKHNFLSQENIIDELMAHVADHHEKHLRVYFNSLKVKLSKINSTINVLTEKTE